jgi:hypothetical protein
MSCIYCLKLGPYSEEHVLTRALSGSGEDWVLKDLVCTICNNLFSRYERAWTSEPGVSIARIHNGPLGRIRRGQAFTFHPAEQMFMEVDGDPVSYEVDILPRITPRLRYQIIDTGSAVVPTASNVDDIQRFKDAWKKFVLRPEVTIRKKTSNENVTYRVALLNLKNSPKIDIIESRTKATDAWWDRFEAGIGKATHPRLSLDPFGRIRFRTSRLKQIPLLLHRIFEAGEINGIGATHHPGSYHIVNRSIYDVNKVHRAIAKTLVNYLTDQLGSTYISNPEFRPVLDYCIGGSDSTENGPFVGISEKNCGIPEIDNAGKDHHALALASNGLRVVGVLKLYGHFTYRVHLGAAPASHLPFIRAVQIEYNGVGRVSR